MKLILLFLGVVSGLSILVLSQKVQAASSFRKVQRGQVLQASTSGAQCTKITVYTVSGTTWTQVTNFSSLRPGQTVRMGVLGAATAGIFDMARFRINGQPSTWTQTQDVNPFGEYYITYTFPSNTNTLSFDVEAQIHHATDGWK